MESPKADHCQWSAHMQCPSIAINTWVEATLRLRKVMAEGHIELEGLACACGFLLLGFEV